MSTSINSTGTSDSISSRHFPLERLPDELLLEVLSNFELNSSHDPRTQIEEILETRAPLAQLILCSRRLNSITTPLLYGTLVKNDARKLPLPVRLSLTRPELGKHVKRIIYNMNFEARHCDHVLATLLCQTPALETLTIFNHGNQDTTKLEVYMTQGFKNVIPTREKSGLLPKLNSVSLYYRDDPVEDDGGFTFRTVVPYLRLNSAAVESFHLDHLVMLDESQDLTSIPNGQHFGAKNLHLEDCTINGSQLSALLARFPTLRCLKYSYLDKKEIGGSVDHFTKELIEAISHLKSCLEVLDVTVNSDSRDPNSGPGIETLADFEVLREISMDRSILLGSFFCKTDNPYVYLDSNSDDGQESSGEASQGNPKNLNQDSSPLIGLLPKSIETLQITNAQFEIFSTIRSLVERKMELVALKRISLEIEYFWPAYDSCQLMDECTAMGIELDLIRWELVNVFAHLR